MNSLAWIIRHRSKYDFTVHPRAQDHGIRDLFLIHCCDVTKVVPDRSESSAFEFFRWQSDKKKEKYKQWLEFVSILSMLTQVTAYCVATSPVSIGH